MSQPEELQTHQDKSVDREKFRENIMRFEKALREIPDAFVGDTTYCPLKHTFSEGLYIREIFIPMGTMLTGKIHKHQHPNFLMRGAVVVVTEEGGMEYLEAPLSMISEAGTKRAVIALEDTVWITIHLNLDNETDLSVLEDHIIAKNFDEFESFRNGGSSDYSQG